MATTKDEPTPGAQIWPLVRKQHGVISRRQLLNAGLTDAQVRHRISRGKLHPVWRGVYAVGRAELNRPGNWMAALLACGSDACLSHTSAAALWEIVRPGPGIHVTVFSRCKVRGLTVYERRLSSRDLRRRDNIPLTSPSLTLVDIATMLDERQLEAAVNEADKLGLIDTERLRADVAEMPRRPGPAIGFESPRRLLLAGDGADS